MKKNLLNLVVVFLAVFALNACKSTDTPEAVAEKYLKHVANQEWAEAKKLGTESTQNMLDMISGFGGEAQKVDVKIEDMNCNVEGDEAECTYKENGEEGIINLVKVDGKWLVDQKKEMGDDMLSDDDLWGDDDWDDEWEDEAYFEEEIEVVEDLVEEVID